MLLYRVTEWLIRAHAPFVHRAPPGNAVWRCRPLTQGSRSPDSSRLWFPGGGTSRQMLSEQGRPSLSSRTSWRLISSESSSSTNTCNTLQAELALSLHFYTWSPRSLSHWTDLVLSTHFSVSDCTEALDKSICQPSKCKCRDKPLCSGFVSLRPVCVFTWSFRIPLRSFCVTL